MAAPHTIEVAVAMWGVLTRLSEAEEGGAFADAEVEKIVQWQELLPGYTERLRYAELIEEHHREGMNGISPRYIQEKLSNAMVKPPESAGR